MKRTTGKEIPMYNDDYDYPDMIECEVVDFLEDCYDDNFKNPEQKKDYGYNQYEEPFKNFDLYGLFDGKYNKTDHKDQHNEYEDTNCLGEKYDDSYDYLNEDACCGGSCECESGMTNISERSDLDKYILNLVLNRFSF